MIEKRSYEATARYFERRASKVPQGPRRRQLELSMQLYRQLATPDETSRTVSSREKASEARASTFSRRQRLIELFRKNGAAEGGYALQESRRSS